MTQILVVYIILINIVTFWVFGHDKRQARNKGWRVPEKTLFLFGGSWREHWRYSRNADIPP